jgi:GntR family transcriptional repressor for pyruvate dehydrogenase complex
MIVDQILKHMETGNLKPGDKLPSERELCKMFGVGRSSVREAIRALVVKGNLEVIQGKGTFLCQGGNTNAQDYLLESDFGGMPVFDIMEARQMLEINIVRLAAERADKTDIRYMHQAIDRMAASKDAKDFYEADLEFHQVLAESTGNQAIREMLNVIMKMGHNYCCNFVVVSEKGKEKSISTARQVANLVAQGEGDQAAAVMMDHLKIIYSKMKGALLDIDKSERDADK